MPMRGATFMGDVVPGAALAARIVVVDIVVGGDDVAKLNKWGGNWDWAVGMGEGLAVSEGVDW
jgi:hypothetical protein